MSEEVLTPIPVCIRRIRAGLRHPDDEKRMMTALAASAELEAIAKKASATIVAEARVQGWSWPQVGRAFGMTHQAMMKRYGGKSLQP